MAKAIATQIDDMLLGALGGEELKHVLLKQSEVAPYSLEAQVPHRWPGPQLQRLGVQQSLEAEGRPGLRVTVYRFDDEKAAMEGADFYAHSMAEVFRGGGLEGETIGESCWVSTSGYGAALVFQRGLFCAVVGVITDIASERGIITEIAQKLDKKIVRYLAQAEMGIQIGQPKEPAIKRLLSNDASTREEAKQELLTARTDLISQLISIVDSEQNHQTRRESVRATMFILGEMRAMQAVSVLVKYVAFADERTVRTAWTDRLGSRPLSQMPAVQALVKIGEPCLKAIISKLATTYDVREQAACIRVLIKLRERDAASAMLVEAAAKEQNTKKRERLHNSLDMLLRVEQPQTNVDQG